MIEWIAFGIGVILIAIGGSLLGYVAWRPYIEKIEKAHGLAHHVRTSGREAQR